jgi:hypothetical protein
MKRSSDIESDSEDTSSRSSDEDKEDDKKKNKKKKKNLDKYLNGLCVTGLSLKDDFCGMARSSSSKRSQKDALDLIPRMRYVMSSLLCARRMLTVNNCIKVRL